MKIGFPQWKVVLQPPFFRGYVSFRGSIPNHVMFMGGSGPRVAISVIQ